MITFDGATLNWNMGCAESNWDVHVGLAGSGAPTGTPSDPGVSSPFVKTGLEASTAYEFYVRANCETDGYSLWTGPVTFTTGALPPSNDNLCDALSITVGDTAAGDAYTLAASTAQASEPVPSCFNSGINGSVWFSFVAPESGQVKVTTDITGGTLTDSEIAVYAADGVTCSDLSTLGTPVGCDQDGGDTVVYNSTINFTGATALTAGATYYIQVDRWGTATAGTFGLRVSDLALGTGNFDDKGFSFYPNPVKDILNLSYNTAISSVSVSNLLGQLVLNGKYDTNNVKVNMSGLARGTYIVKVTVNNMVK
ncbi:MAG: T9SS type A sorting domain-containing protein, partial [Sphingobacteriales bacterium]